MCTITNMKQFKNLLVYKILLQSLPSNFGTAEVTNTTTLLISLPCFQLVQSDLYSE